MSQRAWRTRLLQSRNLRKELGKSRKIYFFDVGLRNALINNFNPMNIRQDKGQLWENFVIVERMKRNAYLSIDPNYYSWRTYDQQEIDLIEEQAGRLDGFEIKSGSNTKIKAPKDWLETYKDASFNVVDGENVLDFII